MPRRVECIPLLGDRLCLDLVNSANWIDGQAADEAFVTADDVVTWARRVLPIGSSGLETWSEAQRADAPAAERLPSALRACRGIIRRLLLASIDPGGPDSSLEHDLETLFDLARRAPMKVVIGEGGFRCEPAAGSPEAGLLASAAISAMELLLGRDRPALRLCPGHRCGWLFLDRSRNGLRRWCQMETCGNRAKARAYHRRSTAP